STATAPARARPLPSNCQSRNRADMANPNFNPDRRLLIIDDNHSIHDDFRKILGPTSSGRQRLDAVEAGLYGDTPAAAARPGFEIVSAYQGEEGYNCVREAAGIGRHFCVAFVDMRMPPGWDGVETTARLWQADPELQVLICTAFADYSWEQITTDRKSTRL